jgi:hypothetical protein
LFWDPPPSSSSSAEGGGEGEGEGVMSPLAVARIETEKVSGVKVMSLRPREETPTNKQSPQQRHEEQHQLHVTPINGGSGAKVVDTKSSSDCTEKSLCLKKGIAFFENTMFSGSASSNDYCGEPCEELVAEEEGELVPDLMARADKNNFKIPTVAESPRILCTNEAMNVKMKKVQSNVNNVAVTSTQQQPYCSPPPPPLLQDLEAQNKSSSHQNVRDLYLHNVVITPDRIKMHHITLKRKKSASSCTDPPVEEGLASELKSELESKAISSHPLSLPPPCKKIKSKSNESTSHVPKRKSRGIVAALPPSASVRGAEGGREAPNSSCPATSTPTTTTTTTTAAATTSGNTRPRPSRRAVSSPHSHRDAFFGSWPTRKQSASKGTWTL